MSEPANDVRPPGGAGSCTNWQLCILCQENSVKKGPLVTHPKSESYNTLRDAIQERSVYQDGDFVRINQRLTDSTGDSLRAHGAVWHRTCYSGATHSKTLVSARKRHAYSVSTGVINVKQRGLKRDSSELEDPHSSVAFTRSQTAPHDKNKCFFCQNSDQNSDDNKLFKVGIENAGKKLQRAVEVSGNLEFSTRLNTAISAGDAHAMDVRYHKNCWTVNVYHVLREAENTGSNECTDNSWKNACLIELINLIDIRTKAKEVISMAAITSHTIRSLMKGIRCIT